MSYVHGTTRIFQHCTFQWHERQIDGERFVEVEANHCERCIAELERYPKAVIVRPKIFPRGTRPPIASAAVTGRVLVVYEECETRAQMIEALQSNGYTVTTAKNGKEALAALVVIPEPIVVVLDLDIPGIPGWDILRALRLYRRFARIPVVLVSGRDVPATAPQGRYRHVLSKPVTTPTLLAAVRLYANAAKW